MANISKNGDEKDNFDSYKSRGINAHSAQASRVRKQ
jgi:hypothetical protein